jgi:NAD(P)-dependent dehydrogenase (short-subunit alcohol dehydrogenase family)
MGRFDDQVVFITGGAQAHGRRQALAFARQGADVALFDLVNGSAPPPDGHPPAPEELEATRREVEATGRRCLVIRGDVQDAAAQLNEAIDRTVRELGRLDVVVARAGVFSLVPATRADALHA